MAGFRFKIEEKNLLVNIVKNALNEFEAQVKHSKNNIEQLGAMHNADVTRNILDKIEGTYTTVEA